MNEGGQSKPPGIWRLTALAIGSMVGAGVFALLGEAVVAARLMVKQLRDEAERRGASAYGAIPVIQCDDRGIALAIIEPSHPLHRLGDLVLAQWQRKQPQVLDHALRGGLPKRQRLGREPVQDGGRGGTAAITSARYR